MQVTFSGDVFVNVSMEDLVKSLMPNNRHLMKAATLPFSFSEKTVTNCNAGIFETKSSVVFHLTRRTMSQSYWLRWRRTQNSVTVPFKDIFCAMTDSIIFRQHFSLKWLLRLVPSWSSVDGVHLSLIMSWPLWSGTELICTCCRH